MAQADRIEAAAPKHEGGFVHGVEDFLHGAAYGAIQTPIDGIEQLINHVSPAHLPHLEIVSAPADDSFWTSAGKVVGSVADFVVMQKLLGAAAPKVFGAESTAPLWLKSGLTGAAFQTMMPTSENGNYFLNKTRDVGIGFGIFGAMGAVSEYVGPKLGSSLLGRVEAGAEGGLAGGATDAAMSDLLYWQKPGMKDLSKIAKYTAFGATLGATSYFEDDLKTRFQNAKKAFEQASNGDTPNPGNASSDQSEPRSTDQRKATSSDQGPTDQGKSSASDHGSTDQAKSAAPPEKPAGQNAAADMTVEQSVAKNQAVFNDSDVVPAQKQLYDVKFRKVTNPNGEMVPTLENPTGETVQQGHWIAQRLDASGQPVYERGQLNQWPIASEAKIAKTYNVDAESMAGKTEFVAPTRVDGPPVHVVRLNEPITIKTSWGTMEGKPGDWLANYDYDVANNTPGHDYAIISGTSFKQTYKVSE